MKKQQKIEPGFLKDLRSALEVKHFTRRTKETYIYWITRYHTFLKSHRDLDISPSKQKVESFLSDLAPNVAAATQNQAFNALLFFYRDLIGSSPRTLLPLPKPVTSPTSARAITSNYHSCQGR
jgi:4-hydroxyphenylpyruvate dioxygenase-like putative hemolysin